MTDKISFEKARSFFALHISEEMRDPYGLNTASKAMLAYNKRIKELERQNLDLQKNNTDLVMQNRALLKDLCAFGKIIEGKPPRAPIQQALDDIAEQHENAECKKCFDTGRVYSNEPDGYYIDCDCRPPSAADYEASD